MISRKKSLFLSVSVLILFVALVAQSCSSENDDFVANPNSSLEMRANLESMDNRATIVNSIAESDELLDYGMNCMLLAEKLKSYTSTLTPEEFDELMNNLNNDDYMIELVSKVDIEKEALMVENARQELLANKSFKLLDESEKMNVFIRFSDTSRVKVQEVLLKRNVSVDMMKTTLMLLLFIYHLCSFVLVQRGGLVYVFFLLVLLLAMTMQQLLLIVVIMIVCKML